MHRSLTLDADVDAALIRACRETGKSFEEVLNDALRTGLLAQRRAQKSAELQITPLKMGLKEGLSLRSVSSLEGLLKMNVDHG